MTQIAFIAGTYQPKQCGVAHYTAHLRAALSQQGVESVVLTTHHAAQHTADSTVQGVVQDWNLRDLLSLVRAVHATHADILHIQHAAGTYGFDRAIFLLPLLLKLTGWNAPIVTTIHEYGWWEWQPRWLPPPLLEWLKTLGQGQGWWDREDGFLLTHSAAIVTTNRDAATVVESRLPGLKQRLHQIPIGINVEVSPIPAQQARQTLRQTCGWSKEKQVIAFFGFLHPVKGLETLLPAFKQVSAVHPTVRLLLIGGVESLALPNEQATQYWEKLKTLINQLDLHKSVYMTGYLDANVASAHLAGADVGVLPFNHGVTLKSGSLLTLMAHGLPVVATYSHPPDLTLSDDLLRLVAPRQVDALATELIQLLTNPVLQKQLGERGRNFSQRFAWSGIAEAHLSIYQTVLAQRSASTLRSAA